MDAEIDSFLLDLEGQRITYSHGPVRPSPFKWPEPAGPRQVRILLSPPAASGVSGLTEDGTWAWFRVLDRSTITPLGTPERFSVTFDVGGRRATFEVRAGSAYNPFDLPELQSFRCPEQL